MEIKKTITEILEIKALTNEIEAVNEYCSVNGFCSPSISMYKTGTIDNSTNENITTFDGVKCIANKCYVVDSTVEKEECEAIADVKKSELIQSITKSVNLETIEKI